MKIAGTETISAGSGTSRRMMLKQNCHMRHCRS